MFAEKSHVICITKFLCFVFLNTEIIFHDIMFTYFDRFLEHSLTPDLLSSYTFYAAPKSNKRHKFNLLTTQQLLNACFSDWWEFLHKLVV